MISGYLEQFSKSLAKEGPLWLQKLRRSGLDRFAELGFPKSDWEDWRFTNMAPLAEQSFQWAPDYQPDALTADKMEQLSHLPLNPMGGCDLVFVNGNFSKDYSSISKLPKGVHVGSLREVLREHPDWAEPYLGRLTDFQDHPFAALNTAFACDGAFVSVEPGILLDFPIHLLFVSQSGGELSVSHPRNLIVAGDHSQMVLIESYLGLGAAPYFTNALTELVAGEGSVVDHYKLQGEGDQAFHIGGMAVRQNRESQLNSHSVSLGGLRVRNDLRTVLAQEGASCRLNGLYLATDHQWVDNHTVIDHARPHCTSEELYKGILAGNSHGVFHGKILVREGAVKTQARQTNKNLLLSDDAVINTTPLLEIFNNDVKCNHGATIGRLDPSQIFYLRSRGIGEENARHILTYAFASDLVAHMKIRSLQVRLEELIALRLARWRRTVEVA